MPANLDYGSQTGGSTPINQLTQGTQAPQGAPAQPMSPELADIFEQLTPEEQVQFMSGLTGDYGGRQTGIDQQLAQATALREGGMPGGRNVRGGFVADSPYSGLANVGDSYLAGRQRAGAMEQQQQLTGDTQNRDRMMADMFRKSLAARGGAQ